MRTKKIQTVALAALTVLAGACSSGHSADKTVAAPSGAGTTSVTGSAAPPSDSAGSTPAASGPAAPASSSAKTLTADELQKALLTGTDVPGYRTGPLAPAPATSAPPSRDCAKVLGSIGSLTAKGADISAGETLQGDAGPGQAASIFVRLQAAPNADNAGAPVADLRQGLANCKIVKGGAPITTLPVTGIGDDAAAFTMDLGTGLVGGTGFLTARVGTVTMTIEAVGTGSGSAGLPELTAQLKAVAAKQVAKVRTALAG